MGLLLFCHSYKHIFTINSLFVLFKFTRTQQNLVAELVDLKDKAFSDLGACTSITDIYGDRSPISLVRFSARLPGTRHFPLAEGYRFWVSHLGRK